MPKMGVGVLCGKGYRAMAEYLGKRFGVLVTEGSVRHYVRTLRREQSFNLVPPRRGWPKKAEARSGAWQEATTLGIPVP